jgi:hypothetical protein
LACTRANNLGCGADVTCFHRIEQLSNEPRSCWCMNAGAIHNDGHTPFTMVQTCHALFNQATERFCISLFGGNTHDCACTPICCSPLVTLSGWMPGSEFYFVLGATSTSASTSLFPCTSFRVCCARARPGDGYFLVSILGILLGYLPLASLGYLSANCKDENLQCEYND